MNARLNQDFIQGFRGGTISIFFSGTFSLVLRGYNIPFWYSSGFVFTFAFAEEYYPVQGLARGLRITLSGSWAVQFPERGLGVCSRGRGRSTRSLLGTLTFCVKWWQVDSQRMLALGPVVYCVVTDLIPAGKNEESFFLWYETLRLSFLISEVRVITHNNL